MLSKPIGKILHYNQKEFGIEGATENAQFRITVYNPFIIRVHFTRTEFDDHSYAVVENPENNNWKLKDEKSKITISTGVIIAEIQKRDGRITFKNNRGKVINEDEKGLGISWIGEQFTNYKTMQEGERFIGLGEKTGPLNRRGHGYEHWNTDTFAYGPGTDPIYSSLPFYIGLHHGLSYGIFLDNSYKSFINFGASNNRFSSIAADAGDLNYYFFYGNGVRDILREYTWLTGRMTMPPMWGLGYQQCRYSYYPDHEVKTIARTFREKEIPADAIVLDIHYMDEYKIYTWDKERFPDPEGMISTLKEQGFHIVLMCDPGIKVEKGYESYESGKSEDIFIKYPDGSYYTGEVWPGWCHFPDFSDPRARAWWKDQLPAYVNIGVEGFWNDMNEIATWGHKLPDNIEFNFDGNPATARKGRNIFGLQMARSTFEATRDLMGKRPFNLTRSSFSGIQRYAAVWTGDNVASDEHMLLGIRLVNSLGLTGVAYAGYDVGGFAGNASEHLFARWIQAGAFSPFFRGHSMVNSRDSEPWAFGEEVEAVSKNYITLRYKLLMYLYSMFYEATVNGMPVSRSLAIDYSHDDHVYDTQFENQYLFGDSILVAPVESHTKIAKVYLPAGSDWYDLLTDKKYSGGQSHFIECTINKMPVFVKSGALIPFCPDAGLHSGDLGNTIEWHLYNGRKDSEFTYYEDDGETYQYEKGKYCKRQVSWNAKEKTVSIQKQEGSFTSKFKNARICLHGFGKSRIYIDGKQQSVKHTDYAFIDPVPSFDPLNKELDHSQTVKDVQVVEFRNKKDAISIKING